MYPQPYFPHLQLLNKVSRFLSACSEWITQTAGVADKTAAGNGSSISLPWGSEVTYKYRSLECRVQVEEADPPPGIIAIWRILGNSS